MKTVFHKFVEEKYSIKTVMLPYPSFQYAIITLDCIFHSIEQVNKVWNLVDIQVVLIITMFEQF